MNTEESNIWENYKDPIIPQTNASDSHRDMKFVAENGIAIDISSALQDEMGQFPDIKFLEEFDQAQKLENFGQYIVYGTSGNATQDHSRFINTTNQNK